VSTSGAYTETIVRPMAVKPATLIMVVRCYGGGTLSVRYQGVSGQVTCDGLTHTAIALTAYPAAPQQVFTAAGDTYKPYTALLATGP
jgi:hypothetical protein